MNVETKEVKNTKEYLLFGWEVAAENNRHIGRSYRKTYTLIRDREMKNYKLILPLEAEYFNLKDQIQTYEPTDKFLAFILILLCIFPGVIYLVYKNSQANKIKEHNFEIYRAQGVILERVKQLR